MIGGQSPPLPMHFCRAVAPASAVFLRQDPSRHTTMIPWDRRDDRVTDGQWQSEARCSHTAFGRQRGVATPPPRPPRPDPAPGPDAATPRFVGVGGRLCDVAEGGCRVLGDFTGMRFEPIRAFCDRRNDPGASGLPPRLRASRLGCAQ